MALKIEWRRENMENGLQIYFVNKFTVKLISDLVLFVRYISALMTLRY
jgi:hypothetical protein